jgi:Fe-S-cluster-containing hydrogenase component 2
MASSNSGTLKQRGGARGPQVLLTHSSPPLRIDWFGDDQPAQIRFADGATSTGVCIRCPDAPCLQYRDVELTIAGLPAFPGDADSRVCPTDAITWPTGAPTPTVDPDACIGCGLCVRRCPVGAIHLSSGTATLAAEAGGPWKEADKPDDARTRELADAFHRLPRNGACATATEVGLQRMHNSLAAVKDKQDTQFPNHLARNLLIATGHPCAMRRRGDVNVRMDLLVGIEEGAAAVGEVEADPSAMIDTPRNILDDAAVMLARYGADRAKIGAVIVGFGLPNQRSEYWQIIEDIAAVTGLKINTLTIGAMIMAVWAGKSLPGLAGGAFFTGGARTIRPALGCALGQKVTLSVGFLGILESQK